MRNYLIGAACGAVVTFVLMLAIMGRYEFASAGKGIGFLVDRLTGEVIACRWSNLGREACYGPKPFLPPPSANRAIPEKDLKFNTEGLTPVE